MKTHAVRSWSIGIVACWALLLTSVVARAGTNDACSEAQTVLCDSTTTQSTTGATSDPNDPIPSCQTNVSHSVWFEFTPPCDGTATIDTVGSDYDTVLAVYSSPCGPLWTEIACHDDIDYAGGNAASMVQFSTTAGTTYLIAVFGFGSNSGNLTLNIVCTSASGIVCPTNIGPVECTSPSGAPVSFTVPTDSCDPNAPVVCSPASGSTFPITTTTVTCTATEPTGAMPTCTFTVTVVDTTPPTIRCPYNITAECTSPSGAVVMFTATATDTCDASPTVVCSPPSGSLFPIATTTVTCTATDDTGNMRSCMFNVTVVDRTAPVITCPNNITAECTSASGAAVTFTATATDACDSSPTIVCTPPSGSTFPFGPTTVSCTATDNFFNESQPCTFTVTIQDTTPPTITCPNNISGVQCTSPSGAPVTFTPTASDQCDPTPTIYCTPASGSIFPIATTTVTCHATDDSHNSSGNCTFTVTVVDTVAPTFSCPVDSTFECTSPSGATATYPTPPATDTCDLTPTVNCVPASGTTFPIGTTTVTCTATDDTGNRRSCTFRITVRDTVRPTITCPGNITAECTRSAGATISYPAPTVTDTCDPNVPSNCSPPAGSTFAIGTTTVTCTATDDSGNTSLPCMFTVTVRDTTAPTIHCSPNLTRDCTSPSGASVNYTTTATDVCDPSPTVACVPPSGGVFPIGTTTVSCTARDHAAPPNTSMCTFTITVRDAIGPVIHCPNNIRAVCSGDPEGTIVQFHVTATDNCDLSMTVACVPPSGSHFSLGGTQVRCAAIDHSGNTSRCSFGVSIIGSTSSDLATTVVGQPASTLIFPLFEAGPGKGTIITVTNLSTSRFTCHNGFRQGDINLLFTYFGFDESRQFCREFNTEHFLTPADTLTVLADQDNPEGVLGWLWVEARDPETNRPIEFNNLIGSAIVVDVGLSFIDQYLAYGFRSYATENGATRFDACGRSLTDLNNDGFADFDGKEYDFWPQRILLDNFFMQGDGMQGFTNELTLASCDVDPFDRSRTIVTAHPWNNRERRFSATFDFECFFHAPLAPTISNVFRQLQGDPNELVFDGHHIQTGWLELDATDPILGVFLQRVVGTGFAAGHQLQFSGQFGGPCDDNPNHQPCALPRVD